MNKGIIYFFAVALLLVSCNKDKEEIEGELELQFVYNGAPFELDNYYSNGEGQEVVFTTLKFYMADLVGYNTNDKTYQGMLHELIDLDPFAPNGKTVTTSISLPEGKYDRFSFGLGLPEEINSSDPAQYESTHPLSLTNNMYWGWSSFYIFTKGEGFVAQNGDTMSWFIHTGLDDLFRPSIYVDKEVDWSGDNPKVTIMLDVADLLVSPNTLDLFDDGQSHTFDNMDLAVDWTDNFANSFE